MDYPYVRAWGRLQGSHSSYIADQVAQARKDKAPQNATHKRDAYGQDGTWATLDDIEDNVTGRATLEKLEEIVGQLLPT